MMRNILYIITLSLLAISCARRPSITVLCEKDQKGNYILKWELFPDYGDLPVEVFMSDTDTEFPSEPALVVNSDNYIATINDSSENQSRKYFKLRILGEYSGIVSNRFFALDSVQNFRDLGGYYTNDYRQVKWGKIYRSGCFKYRTERDEESLTALGIQTVLDIQSRQEKDSVSYGHTYYCRIPISDVGYDAVSQQIANEQFTRGDAVSFTQDMYKDLVENYTEEYRLLFDQLLDDENYPLVVNCYFGKDQTGVASYLILSSLDVPDETAEEDYMLSNLGIDRFKLRVNVDDMSEAMQESLTLITQTELASLKYAISIMKRKSGSVDKYLTEEIGLNRAKRLKLRKMLLY